MPLDPSTKKYTPRKNDFVSVTEMKPPDLTEYDRNLINQLLEGVIVGSTQKIEDAVRDQLRECGWIFSVEGQNRIREILEIVDWSIWRGQFGFWLRQGKWY